jgi:hypothetical protein
VIAHHLIHMDDGRPLKNRLLSRIPFVRTSLEEIRPSQSDMHTTTQHTTQKSPPTSPPIRRKRTGSLRKTLLTTGHIVASSRKAALFARQPPPPLSQSQDSDVQNVSSPTEQSRGNRYGSTTDEDNEGLTLRPRSTSGSYPQITPTPPTSNPGISRRRSSRSATQMSIPAMPLVNGLPTSSLTRYDYSETEWWGWIILLATWIVFVVGMGSCLEVWSWAWDVGETPYAPPELEDDPTLPIVGYYPALIIMTGVMAWVWVIAAWVGMKYFRHAKVWDGEDY